MYNNNELEKLERCKNSKPDEPSEQENANIGIHPQRWKHDQPQRDEKNM